MCNIRPVLSAAVTLFHCGPVIKVTPLFSCANFRPDVPRNKCECSTCLLKVNYVDSNKLILINKFVIQ
jgi:hypothetical protein